MNRKPIDFDYNPSFDYDGSISLKIFKNAPVNWKTFLKMKKVMINRMKEIYGENAPWQIIIPSILHCLIVDDMIEYANFILSTFIAYYKWKKNNMTEYTNIFNTILSLSNSSYDPSSTQIISFLYDYHAHYLTFDHETFMNDTYNEDFNPFFDDRPNNNNNNNN